MSWRNADFDHVGGTKLYLQRLASSPLVRQSLPNAAAICQQYFAFRRQHGEAMHAFLVREALGYSEFIEALERLKDDKMGIEQHEKDFDLPEEYVTDEAELGEDQPDPDDDDDRGDRARPSPSPTPRPAAGDTDGSVGSPLRPPPRSTPSRHSAAVGPDDPGFSLADSFVLGVLRGFRLLQAAGLNADEKRDIVSATRGSLEFEVIVKALQTMWDEQLLGRPGVSHQSQPRPSWRYQNMIESPMEESDWWLQDYAAETDWDSWTDPNYDQYYGYGDNLNLLKLKPINFKVMILLTLNYRKLKPRSAWRKTLPWRPSVHGLKPSELQLLFDEIVALAIRNRCLPRTPDAFDVEVSTSLGTARIGPIRVPRIALRVALCTTSTTSRRTTTTTSSARARARTSRRGARASSPTG